MKPLLADVHTHSLASGHSYGTIREMAAEAASRNLLLLGVTEHGPGIAGTCDPIYFRNFVDAPRTLYGVEMLYGCEVNILLDGKLDLDQRTIGYLDYAVAGFHRQTYDNQGIVKNTDDVFRCMENKKVRFISHPDNQKYPLDYPTLVAGAKAHNVALELNNASLRKEFLRPGAADNYKVLIPLCMEQGVPMIVNTDAHDPGAVGDFSYAYRLLEQLDIRDELILNNDIAKLKAFLLEDR